MPGGKKVVFKNEGITRTLHDVLMILIWDNLNTKIIKDCDEFQTFENIELESKLCLEHSQYLAQFLITAVHQIV